VLDGKLLKALGRQPGLDRLLLLLSAASLNHVFGCFADRTVACSKDGSLPEIHVLYPRSLELFQLLRALPTAAPCEVASSL